MKSYDSDDELERALFALPLESPPADLRATILAATIYRPELPVRPWEMWLFGACAAVIVWLCALILRGGAAPVAATLDIVGRGVLAYLSQTSLLLWIALGGGAAAIVSQVNLTGTPGHQRSGRR